MDLEKYLTADISNFNLHEIAFSRITEDKTELALQDFFELKFNRIKKILFAKRRLGCVTNQTNKTK